MNKFVTTALAVAAAGSLSYADPGDNDWLELDGEINDLATALRPAQDDASGWSALIRGTFDYSTDDIVTDVTNTTNEIAGFQFRDIDLAFYGGVGSYGWRISGDLDGNQLGGAQALDLEDAHIFFDCGQYVTVTLGSQKPQIIRSGYVDPGRTLFIDRTAIGSVADTWDNGVTAGGMWESFDYSFGFFNGNNSNQKDHLYVLHVAYNFGAGAGDAEGAANGDDNLNFTVGGSFVKDDTTGIADNLDDTLWVLDLNGNMGQISGGFEVAGLGDGWDVVNVNNDWGLLQSSAIGGATALFSPDSTPWNLTGGFMLNPDWEFGLRYQDTDNLMSTKIISAVVAWYRTGHAGKWQLQWQNFNSDTGSSYDGNTFSVGYTVGATR